MLENDQRWKGEYFSERNNSLQCGWFKKLCVPSTAFPLPTAMTSCVYLYVISVAQPTEKSTSLFPQTLVAKRRMEDEFSREVRLISSKMMKGSAKTDCSLNYWWIRKKLREVKGKINKKHSRWGNKCKENLGAEDFEAQEDPEKQKSRSFWKYHWYLPVYNSTS